MLSIKKLLTGVALSLIVSTSLSAAMVDECSKELLLAYFPEPFLVQVLKDNDVPESEWAAINQALMSKDRQVVSMVEEKAAAMDPNPLTDAKYRPQAVQLFRETLFEIFAEVMRNHGVTEDAEIQSMLDQIQYLKAERFPKCMEMNQNAVDSAFKIQSRGDTRNDGSYTAMMVEESNEGGGEEDVDVDESETEPDNSDTEDFSDTDDEEETTHPFSQ